MPNVSIVTSENSILIHIDKSVTDTAKINQLLEFVRLTFVDFSPIPEVSNEEQQEIETLLNTMSADDKIWSFTRTIDL
jgi:hypothetical protein